MSQCNKTSKKNSHSITNQWLGRSNKIHI